MIRPPPSPPLFPSPTLSRPPPPPPNVPELPEHEKDVAATSLRQRMEVHRRNPACANCHAKMDPIGFALENFNAVGAYRSEEHTSELQSQSNLVCRLLLEKKK